MRRTLLRTFVAATLVVATSAQWVLASPAPVVVAQLGAPSASASPTAPSSASSSAGATDDAKRQEAIEHFNRGVELMQNESWDAAYAEFSASLALVPTKNGRKNAAICLRQLGRFDEALAMYEALVAEFSAKLTPQEMDLVQKSMSELRALTGYVVVRSSVAGATVVIDGKDRGKTPLAAPVLVAAGTHVVRVSKEGYLPFETKELVAGKSTITVDATLETLARSGHVRVEETSGKSLDVVVDGAVVGKTPYDGALSPGLHAVWLRGEGRIGTQPATANVVVDQTTVLRLAAEPLEAEARIEPDPAGATVAIDGVVVGQGTWEGPLRVGAHKVDVSAEGYFAVTKSFDAPKDQKTPLKIQLDRDEASPFWAKGRQYPLSVALFGAFAVGKSLGGDYEKCAAPVSCSDHSLAMSFLGGVRGGYELVPGLSLELDFGFAYLKGKVSRSTTLVGDNPAPANITDDFHLSGPLFAVGVAYAFVRRPVVFSGAFVGGVLIGKLAESRNGTVTADSAPTDRPLLNQQPIETLSKVVPVFMPELRLGVPLSERFQLGAGLGVLIGVSDTHPLVVQSPAPDVDATGKPIGNARYQGKTIGAIRTSETATGTFVLPQISIFARVAF